MKSIQRALLASSLLGCSTVHADSRLVVNSRATEAPSSSATGLLLGKFSGETAWDRAWSAFTLYKNEDNPILQEFSLQGRLQVQYADGHSNGHFDIEDYKADDKDEAVWGDHFEARSARFGFKSKWFRNWIFEGQINVDTDGRDGVSEDHTLYKDIYDLYITYAPSDALNISAGKTEVKFTREQEISSKEILTIERGLLTTAFFPGELTGVWIRGKGIGEHWLYELGFYGSDRQREFSKFDAGAVILGKIGYDYSSLAGLDSAVASFHYMHNTEPGFGETQTDDNYKPSNSSSFGNSIALTNDITHGRFGLTTDVVYGFGFNGTVEQNETSKTIDQSDVFGISVIPSYFLTEDMQLVVRFQWATSEDDDGLGLPNRYENYAPPVPKGDKGDSYASTYIGLNYYLYGHKFKLMNGIEYSKMGGGDYDGYTFMSGLRFSF